MSRPVFRFKPKAQPFAVDNARYNAIQNELRRLLTERRRFLSALNGGYICEKTRSLVEEGLRVNIDATNRLNQQLERS